MSFGKKCFFWEGYISVIVWITLGLSSRLCW